jgi:hypothetical protein
MSHKSLITFDAMELRLSVSATVLLLRQCVISNLRPSLRLGG